MKNKRLTVVIDMLNGFCKFGPLSSQRINRIIPNIVEVLNKSDDILFVCDAHSIDDLEMKQYPIHCLKDSLEAEVVDELKPYQRQKNAKTVLKNTTNGFYEVLPSYWDQYDEFEFVGCCTDICVLQFVMNLKIWFNKIGSKKPIYVIQKCVETFDSPTHNGDEMHKLALQLMQEAGVEIV
ncbi:nicotinamidase-related amidase [Mycoplasmopsis mustelae]|uniref:Nicotinamidase-related amidase n=1 Tax=Mycoplasmopsis mustelae TaxID=171289 RepID=A0A4R7UDF5_9BACT|nr:isochorismatase family cysteine hydrolase [Mycoplasmopsis mustelae]TDV24459.1 nicotinamidase-related amidase [Mycoplasmopsis mustelae]